MSENTSSHDESPTRQKWGTKNLGGRPKGHRLETLARARFVHIAASAGLPDLVIVGAIENREVPYPGNRADRRKARELVNRWALPKVFGRLERDERAQQRLGHALRTFDCDDWAGLGFPRHDETPRQLLDTADQLEAQIPVYSAAREADYFAAPIGAMTSEEYAASATQNAALLRGYAAELKAKAWQR